MQPLSLLSDTELLARLPAIVQAERIATADVVEHLMEVERRRLYLAQACSSLYVYCRERLRYSEDAALKRARVARLAVRFPRVLDELRSSAIHLTGLFLVERYLNDENAEELLTLAHGMSRRELEKMLALRFPRPDVPSKIELLAGAPGDATGGSHSEAASGPSPWFACPETATAAARERSDSMGSAARGCARVTTCRAARLVPAPAPVTRPFRPVSTLASSRVVLSTASRGCSAGMDEF